MSARHHRELFDSCIRLAWQIINEYSSKWPRLADDLESTGLFTLWRAALAFDPSRGFKFSTYSATCIHRQCRRLISQETRFRHASLTASAEDDDALIDFLAIRQPPVGAALEAKDELANLPQELVAELGMAVEGWTSSEIDAATGTARQTRRRRQEQQLDEVRNARRE